MPTLRPFPVAMAVTLVMVAGCSGGKSGTTPHTPRPSASGGAETPIASMPMAHLDGPAHVDLLALSRTANNTVTARLRVVNDGDSALRLGGALVDQGGQGSQRLTAGTSGISLVDGIDNRVYYPLSTTDGKCLCSDKTVGDLQGRGTLELFAVYPAPPAKISRVTVWVPLTLPFNDIAIGTGSAPSAPGQTADPAGARLAQPVVRTLNGTAEGTQESIDQNGDNTSVRLSADVLFALNKADLTAAADSVLRDLAGKIDASPGPVVKVDGYTDNTGNDAINNPLSQQRAQAVEARLRTLVTRQGVTYQTAGHGSADPVAPNDTDAGRQKNRRVTVTFARPAPTPPVATPGVSSAPTLAPGKLPVLGSVQPNFQSAPPEVVAGDHLKFDVNVLHRDAAGLVTAIWTITNLSDQEQGLGAGIRGADLKLYSEPAASGTSLVDTTANMRYWPSRDGANSCLCTQLVWREKDSLKPHESVTYSAIYQVPASISSMDVDFAWYNNTVSIKGLTIR